MCAEVARRAAPGDDDGRGAWRGVCSGCGQRNPGHPGSRCPGKLVIISEPPQDLLAGCRLVDVNSQRQQVADLLARGVPLAPGDVGLAPRQAADPPDSGDSSAGRDASLVPSGLPAYAADLVAGGASLSYTRTALGGCWVVTPSFTGDGTLTPGEDRWAKVVSRLRVFARRQERRRAGYFYALDRGVGRALGWTEHADRSHRYERACRLLVAALREARTVLFEHGWGAFGVAVFTALYRLLPGAEEARSSGVGNVTSSPGDL